MMVGRRVSFWDCYFVGAMLNFWGVFKQGRNPYNPIATVTGGGRVDPTQV